MKVLLINLCLRHDTPKKIYPVGLGYVASAIHRAGYPLEIVNVDIHRYSDEELKAILSEKDFDVVGFGCIATGYRVVKDMTSLIRSVNKSAVIIVGNSVATSIPNIVLEKTEADIAVIGEGDVTVVELLKCLERKASLESVDGICFKKNNKVIANKPRPPLPNIDQIPLPEWDLFEMDTYVRESKNYVSEPYPMPKDDIRAMPLNTARGCVFRCTFCYHVFKNNMYRFRSPASIIKEIKEFQRRYKINYINFWDELTFSSKAQAEALMDELLKEDLGIFWTGACRSDLFKHKDDAGLAKKFKLSGCVGLSYSLESANAAILKSMNKRLNTDDFAAQKHILDDAGIITWTSLVLGYPEETEETINETMEFCFRHDLYPSAGFLLPQPGTPMYDYIIANGIIKDVEGYLLGLGDRQDLRVNLTKMPSERFVALVKGHLERINKKLNLNLDKDRLLKSGHYKAKSWKECGNI